MEDRTSIITFVLVTTAFIVVLVAFIVWLLFLYSKRYRVFIANQAEKIMTAKLEMQELTFQNISREIHDNVKLSLMLVKLNLHKMNRQDEEDMDRKIFASIDTITKAIIDLNNISRSLNADWIRGQGLMNALGKEIDRLITTGLYNVEAKFSGNMVIMDAEKELMIFRIVQEAFNNILKHSEAKNITFLMEFHSSHASLIISDDGKGFDYPGADSNKNGTGLGNIKSRAHKLNGKTKITTAPGQGTAVSLTVPYGF